MTGRTAPIFVSTEWLASHLDDADIVVIDGTWYLPGSERDAKAEYATSHIPGAVHFDIDAIADTSSGLPHMLPTPEDFARMVGAMGIGSDRMLVVYDEPGLFSAPRVWWTLKTMGAPRVRILDGGGAKWRAEHRPLESGITRRAGETFATRFEPETVADFDRVLAASSNGAAQILDARAADRFAGNAPEPRPGLRSGHIPGSHNLPSSGLVADGRLVDEAALKQALEASGIDITRPVITSCGSGVTAATLALALEVIGAREVALYDGSWAEWGGREEAPVQTGSA